MLRLTKIFLIFVVCQALMHSINSNPALEVVNINENVINFIIREEGKARFEMPKNDPFPFHPEHHGNNNFEPNYIFEKNDNPFSLSVKRKSTNEVIYCTVGNNVVFNENYAEISVDLSSKNLFGLGERTANLKLKSGIYSIYNRDAYGDIDDGKGNGHNRYGSHPVYLMREESGSYHVVYLRNSLPMDVVVSEYDDGKKFKLTYKITGGVFDFSIFLGDRNPETSLKMYHEFLGKHILPPFWSLGFHQSRWGYKDLTMLQDVLKKYSDYKLPLDTLWMDIDYMKEYVPFTVDEERYNTTLFKETLNNYKKKFVMIAEPAMSTKWADYKYLTEGIQLDLFIKNSKGEYLRNVVWPGVCYFIDYFNDKTPNYWYKALDDLHEKLNFAGVWLDMNEVATFNFGQTNADGQTISCDDNTHFPYLPGGQPLERNTICPNSVHSHGYKHFEVHNYNSVAQQMLTHNYLEKKFPDQFPFILSRANAAGTNKWSFHWTGDNLATFDFYKMSISEVISSNLSGIPMSGADICGFAGNPNETLCAKFYQMGSLFPFSRSHSHTDNIRKEPWMMGDLLLETTRKSLAFGYSILKFYYSIFIKNSGTGTIFKPIFFNFYENDETAISDNVIDNQFMIGEEFLVVPNLNQNDDQTNVNGYFPKGSWYDLRYNTLLLHTDKGETKEINAVLKEMPPVFLRGGKTIFTNNVVNISNSYDLDSNFNVVIALDKATKTSAGSIPALINYHSKQSVNQCIGKNCWINVNTTYGEPSMGTLRINISKANFYSNDYDYMTVSSFKIFGINIQGSILEYTNIENYIEPAEGDHKINLASQVMNQSRKVYSEFLMYMEESSNDEKKYSIEVVNDNYFIIHINGKFKIKKEDMLVIVQFKN